MELILADASGRDIRVLEYDFDIEVGGSNTFEITIPNLDWKDDIGFGKRVYIQGTEYGGIIQDIETDGATGQIYVRGRTWRGYFETKFATGTFAGNMNVTLAELLGSYSPVIKASTAVAKSAYGTFAEYTSIGEIVDTLCMQSGQRLNLSYMTDGYIEAAAVAREEYTEVSQDSFLVFNIEDDRMGVNHLICTNGSTVSHLYADAEGNISLSQKLFGIDEIVDVYEYSGDDPGDQAVQQLQGLVSQKTMKVDFTSDKDIDFQIGDLVAGKDYITGFTLSKPITKKIIKRTNGVISIQYSVEDRTQ